MWHYLILGIDKPPVVSMTSTLSELCYFGKKNALTFTATAEGPHAKQLFIFKYYEFNVLNVFEK